MLTFPIWRSMLFLPAHVEKFIDKAHTRGAQAYILDLEDSVPEEHKAAARKTIVDSARTVSQSGAAALVRINGPLRLAIRDLEAVVSPGVRAIVLPKISAGEQVRALAAVVQELEVERGMEQGHTLMIAQIECVAALAKLDGIAASSPRLMGMILGSEDFSASAGMSPVPQALFAPNQQVLMACRRAGILPLGFPASIADYSDQAAFRETIFLAKQLGFVGAFCIHPSQVAILNEVLEPSGEELDEARAIIEAFETARASGRAAVEYKGKMIDPPVIDRAREVLRNKGHED